MFLKVISIVMTFVISFTIAAITNMETAYCNDEIYVETFNSVTVQTKEETTSFSFDTTSLSEQSNAMMQSFTEPTTVKAAEKTTVSSVFEPVTILPVNKVYSETTTKAPNKNHISISNVLSVDIVVLNHIGAQKDVDNNDVVSDLRYGGQRFVYGHNYRTFGNLHKTSVGDNIHLTINGKTKVYIVFVSEYGVLTADERNIVGQETGVKIYDSFESEVIRLYTCYGNNENGRWIVMAQLVY